MVVSDENFAEYRGGAMKTKAGNVRSDLQNASIG